jgi:uncharacterized FlgJ-related protein
MQHLEDPAQSASEVGMGADELAAKVDNLTAQWRLWGKTLKVQAHAMH